MGDTAVRGTALRGTVLEGAAVGGGTALRRLLLVTALVLTSIGAVSPTPAPDECAQAGTSDFDGDGYNDAAVGDPFAASPDGTDAGAGRLFLLRGRRAGGTATPPAPAIAEFEAGAPGWTARASHIDGDRCMDLVVANPFAYGSAGSAQVRGAGVAYIYWGGRDFGRAGAPRLELKAPMARTGAHFGWSLAVTDRPVVEGPAAEGPAADGPVVDGPVVDGPVVDGPVVDGPVSAGLGAGGTVAVGAPHEDADEVADSGAVYVYQFNGRSPAPPQRITQNSPGVPGNGEAGDMFGWSVALGGLGGQRDPVDLVVGAPFEDREVGGQTDTGAVTVVYDVSTGPWSYRGAGWDLPAVTPDVPSGTGDHLGYSVAYGRHGTKGYLAVGAPTTDFHGVRDAGAVLLFQAADPGPRFLRVLRQGSVEGGGDAVEGYNDRADAAYGFRVVADSNDERDRFGFSLAFAGPSLLVGTPGESQPGAPESGAVHVISLAGTPSGRMLTEERPAPYDHFGWSVSGAADGRFLVGAPDRGVTGAVTIGQSSDLITRQEIAGEAAPHVLSPAPAGPGGKDALDFGATLAG